jgi:colanic acid/amylovoran biosynthesis glycosyltransferase
MPIALISAEYPFGSSESFLVPELEVIAGLVGEVVVYPIVVSRAGVRGVPPGVSVEAIPLFGLSTFLGAVRAFFRRPLPCVRLLAALACSRRSFGSYARDFAVIPKALCIAEDVRRRGITHIHAYWLSTPATVAFLAARLTGIPYSMTGHRWDIYETLGQSLKARGARFIRTISQRASRDLAANLDRETAGAIVLIHLGVRIPASTRDPAGFTPLRIIVPASFVPVKDHATLLSALKIMRDRNIAFHCLFAGDGPLRRTCEEAAREAGLSAFIEFAGHLSHDDLLRRYAEGSVDVCVLSSSEDSNHLMEGIPVTLMEAMASGTLCVATRTGSIGELIDETCGILVRQRSPHELAEALMSLVHDPARAADLARAGRHRIVERFDVGQNARLLVRLILGQANA